MTRPPCAFIGVGIPCGDCNRLCRIQSCYDNIKKQQQLEADRMGKTVCEQKNVLVSGMPLSQRKSTTVTNAGARIVMKSKRSDTCVS